MSYRVARYINRHLGLPGSRPTLEMVSGLPAYETRGMADKVCQMRRQREGWFFHSAPWLVVKSSSRCKS